MEESSEFCGVLESSKVALQALRCPRTNSNDMGWPQIVQQIDQKLIAKGLEFAADFCRQFVRGKIASGSAQEGQRTIVVDKCNVEKCGGIAEEFGKESPESSPRNFRTGAAKPLDRPFGVRLRWLSYRGFDFQPIFYGGNFAEGNAGLGHSERAGIHAEEDDFLRRIRILHQIGSVGFPRIIERIVDRMHGFVKIELLTFVRKVLASLKQFLRIPDGHGSQKLVPILRMSSGLNRKEGPSTSNWMVEW